MKKLGNEASNTLLMISSMFHSLSKAEQKVADVVKSDAENTVYSSITDLAEAAEVGETTIVRFCRKLGFHGFQEFKLAIAQDLVSPGQQVYGRIEEDDEIEVISSKITANNMNTLQDTDQLLKSSDFHRVTEVLLSRKRIFFFGVGSSGLTANDAQYRFMRLGFDAYCAVDSHVIAMNCSLVGEGDIVFGISTSGSTKDLVDAIRIAKNNGAFVICLTNHARSPITSYADAVLLAAAKESPLQGGAYSSKIAQIHVFDILSTIISIKRRDVTFSALERTAKAVLDKLY